MVKGFGRRQGEGVPECLYSHPQAAEVIGFCGLENWA